LVLELNKEDVGALFDARKWVSCEDMLLILFRLIVPYAFQTINLL